MNVKLLKAQSLLQEALQEVLFDLEDTRLKNIAITRVECSRGKEVAKVFLDKNSLGEVDLAQILKLLKKASGVIKANLQAQLSWYRTPNLTFAIDDSLAEMNKLEAIFRQIHAKENAQDSSLQGESNANNPFNARNHNDGNGIDCLDSAIAKYHNGDKKALPND